MGRPVTGPAPTSDVLAWGDRIDCHATDPTARKFRGDGTFEWQLRDGTPICPYCGSVAPRWLFDHFAAIAPTIPPWRRTCRHERPHLTADDFRACETELRDPTWVGVEVADQKYGWPHKLYLHPAPPERSRKFYTLHLRDLPAATLEVVSAVIQRHTGIRFFVDGGGFGFRHIALEA